MMVLLIEDPNVFYRVMSCFRIVRYACCFAMSIFLISENYFFQCEKMI